MSNENCYAGSVYWDGTKYATNTNITAGATQPARTTATPGNNFDGAAPLDATFIPLACGTGVAGTGALTQATVTNGVGISSKATDGATTTPN